MQVMSKGAKRVGYFAPIMEVVTKQVGYQNRIIHILFVIIKDTRVACKGKPANEESVFCVFQKI